MLLSSPPAFLAFCRGCMVPCLLFLALGRVRFWPAVSTAPVRCEVCSLGCPSWLVLLFLVSVCPSPALAVGWFGHSSVAPPAAPVCWALVGSLLRRSVALACCRILSFCGFSPGFLSLAFVRTWVGRLRSCLGSCLLLGELSFPCPGCFRLAVPTAWLSRLLEFSWTLCWGSFLSLPVFADSLGWLRIVLGYPPSVAWQRKVLPWFSVRGLSACPRGAAVPLGSSVLRCSGLRDGVSCLRSGLCSSSVRDRDEDFPSFLWVWFLAFVRVPCLRLELCSSE